jgi:hypothetical protein
MSAAELADLWDAEAMSYHLLAGETRSLSLSVYEQFFARGSQLRQCAMQLRMAAGIATPNDTETEPGT